MFSHWSLVCRSWYDVDELHRLMMYCSFLSAVGNHEALMAALDLQTVDVYKVVQEGAPLLRSGGEVG